MDWTTFKSGDLVWFDPNNNGFHIPGEIQEVHHAAQVLTVDAVIDGKVSFHTYLFSLRKFIMLQLLFYK